MEYPVGAHLQHRDGCPPEPEVLQKNAALTGLQRQQPLRRGHRHLAQHFSLSQCTPNHMCPTITGTAPELWRAFVRAARADEWRSAVHQIRWYGWYWGYGWYG